MDEKFERRMTLYLLIAISIHEYRDWDFAWGLGNMLPGALTAAFAIYTVWSDERKRKRKRCNA